eukprot:jgi/Botrbrau1/12787/Bobra.117_1s0006.1
MLTLHSTCLGRGVEAHPPVSRCKPFTKSYLPPARARATIHQSINRRDLLVRCSAPTLTVKEPATGVEFPGGGDPVGLVRSVPQLRCWSPREEDRLHFCQGVCGVALRGGQKGGWRALIDGAFNKALQIQLVRDIDGKTFYTALEEALAQPLKLRGDSASLEKFGAFFQDQKLAKGTNVTLLWRQPAALEVIAAPAGTDLANASPPLTIESPSLCRVLFERYLGEDSLVPLARASWASGARALLATEEVRRDSRKSGG